MKYRDFSDLGWRVSEIGLGCWQLGWCWGDPISDQEAEDIIFSALDKGVNFFDTSDTYGDGRSERFLSKIKKTTKEKIYISTKLGRRTRGTKYSKGYKHEPMEEFIDRSLKNLDTDCIDLLQLHCPSKQILSDPESYELLDKIVKKGKISHYGVSVWNISDAMEAVKFKNVKSIQIVFNIFRQKPIDEFLKKAKKNNIAVIARGPLASGLLSGKITNETIFPKNDHRNYNIDGNKWDVGDTFSGVNFEKGLIAVERLRKIVPSNYDLSQLALKWILQHDEITLAIPGAVNKFQVEANSKVSEMENIDDLMRNIREIYDEIIKPDVHHRW